MAETLAHLLPTVFGVVAHGDRLVVPCLTPEGTASFEIEVYPNGTHHLRCGDASVVRAVRALGRDDVAFILGAHELRWDDDAAIIWTAFRDSATWQAEYLKFRDGVLAIMWSASQLELERAGQAHLNIALDGPAIAKAAIEAAMPPVRP